MAKPKQEDRVTRFFERLKAAEKAYERWVKRFRCDVLQEYYCGEQWPEFSAPEKQPDYRPYTINLIFPTIESQQPALLFYRPTVKIEPKPPYGDDPASTIAQRAKLCEDTLQTFIDKPEVHFKLQTLLALRDANFRFGIIEVGYTADWIDNPHAGKPVLKEKTKEDDPDEPVTVNGEPVNEPDKLPKSEQLFLKRIDPKAFRVSISGKNVLDENDGCGYFEWHYVEDVKRNPRYQNTSTLKATGEVKDQPSANADEEREQHKGMVKLWKWWDFRTKTRCVYAEGHKKPLLEGEAWDYLPLSVLKFYEIPGEFYPLPPVANWIGPQDAINEGREARRTHRRRYHRRYTVHNGAMDDTELEKIENGPDGTIAKRNTAEDTLKPVLDAPLGPDNDKDILEAKEDFQQITGIVDEQTVGQSDTATQANIVDVRSKIRESASRVQVADWLSDICRIMLLTIRDKMQLPMWIQQNADAIAQDPNEILRIVQSWKKITAEDMGDGSLTVSVDMTSLSPVSEEQRAAQWNQMLALLINPQIAMVLSMSEPMLRKTLKFYGITSEGDIREIGMVLKNMLMMQMAQAQAASGAGTPAGEPSGQPAGMPAASGSVQ